MKSLINSLAKRTRIFILVAATVTAFTNSPTAEAARTWAHSSQLASGKWVRIETEGEGIHQITYDQLRSWGFDNPSKVKVFGYGPATLGHNRFDTADTDDLPAIKCLHTDDGRILFYATNAIFPYLGKQLSSDEYQVYLLSNKYTTHSYYFISDSGAGANMAAFPYNAAADAETIDNHVALSYYENENFNPGEGGYAYLDRKLSQGETMRMSFDIHDFYTGEAGETRLGRVDFQYGLKGDGMSFSMLEPQGMKTVTRMATYTEDRSDVRSSLNYVTYKQHLTFTEQTDGTPIADGSHTFSARIPYQGRQYLLAFDRAYLTYPRHNTVSAAHPELVMHLPVVKSGSVVTVKTPAPLEIWNVSDPRAIRAYETVYDEAAGTAGITVERDYQLAETKPDCRIVAFDATATFDGVTFVDEVENQNIHSDIAPEMVIICTDELLPYAQELADAHMRSDNIRVNVYTQKQVFNEFGYGNPTGNAFRRLAKMFYDRTENSVNRFKALLLYGACSYDNLGVELEFSNERLLCYELEPYSLGDIYPRNPNTNYSGDMFFGLLNDYSDGTLATVQPKQIAVGRIPATNPGDAANANAKLVAYIDNPPSPEVYTRLLLFSDDGDSNLHFNQSLEVGRTSQLNYPLTMIQPHNSLYDRPNGNNPEGRKALVNGLNAGVGYFNYTGHGNSHSFTAEKLYTQNFISSTTYDVYPLAMLSTCDSYAIDRNKRHIGESMLFQPGGGAIAVVGACRSVYAVLNQQINVSMIRAYSTATPGQTVGDIFLAAHNNALRPSSYETSANTMCYNLCGDPAVRIPIPSRNAKITSVNGVTDASTTVVVNPLQDVEICGEAVDESTFTRDPQFNGTAEITIYESPYYAPVVIMDKNDKADSVLLDQTVLARTTVPVVDGRFTARMRIPLTTTDGRNSRIAVTVIDGKNPRNAAICFASNLRIDGSEVATPAEGTPANIATMYMGDASFTEGGIVGQNTELHAIIELGDAGLNMSPTVGSPTKVILDGRTSLTNALNALKINADNTATLNMPITDLSQGSHFITLSVANNNGNRVERSISFTVTGDNIRGRLTADTRSERDQVTLDMAEEMGQMTDTRLVITDHDGRTVFSVRNPSMPYTWRMTDTAGNEVPDGRYEAFMLGNSGLNHAATPRVTFTVVRSLRTSR